jgi:hypothetical protein
VHCPECNGEMQTGFVNAWGWGVIWQRVASAWLIGKSTERLQADGWGFPKFKKEPLSAFRCQRCKLVLFRYTADA